jgi:hypothetical protein
MSMSTFSTRTVVVAVRDQVSCDLGGEAAILNLRNGVYYGLDPVGARIWNLIQQPRRVHELQEILVSEYVVEAERCSSDLLALLERLREAGLIDIRE